MTFFDQSLTNRQAPVWFMRQAGRYHNHYQKLKQKHSFMELCKTPDLATEVTMGPMDEFGFDAAILFSDLLFPLEHLGLGLHYNDGPPKLLRHLKSLEDFNRLGPIENDHFYQFQGDALRKLRARLAPEKTLLGFVGAPFTLYTYAVEGSHAGNLHSSKQGLFDGRFEAFWERLRPSLLQELRVQASSGADALCFFDTAVGELGIHDFKDFIVPALGQIVTEFKQEFPQHKVIYYSKLTHFQYLDLLQDLPIDVFGVDWRTNLKEALTRYPQMIQGNIDPSWLHYPWSILEKKLEQYWHDLKEAPLNKWICGLGHGVTVGTPQENVKNTVQFIHQHFKY